MNLLFCLEDILSYFRPLFNQQNFALFQAMICGFIANTHGGTLTRLYQSKFLRDEVLVFYEVSLPRAWDVDAVAARLVEKIQEVFSNWVYVYDLTSALKTGKKQFGLHFFRNFKYQKGRVNQSKFHFGHEFAALGLLCETPRQWILFPVWVRLIVPEKLRDKSDAVLKRIFSSIPRGLVIFDRGFARRKVFQTLLALKHHILCRAKSNAVFYRIPKRRKRPGPGRPKKYGDCLNIRRLRYKVVSIMGKDYQVASQIVRTKMCPADVRLVVIRTKPKPSKPYRYFSVFTTDLTLEIPWIVEYYRQRWQIETAFRDAKQHFGFSGYQVRSRKSINRFLQLSFVAASLTKLIFSMPEMTMKQLSVEKVSEQLGIHWYKPKKLTQGLRVAYLQAQIGWLRFSTSSKEKTNSQNIQTQAPQDNTLPFDKAA